MITKEEYEKFVSERDKALMAGDLEALEDLAIAYGANISKDAPMEIRLAGMHKAITTVKSLPREHRMKSARWLRERGYTSFDGGDLADA